MRPYACVECGRLCEPKTTNSHLQGASFAYDGVHAQNGEALTDRSTFIVRVRSPASRRDVDRAGRLTPGGASLSFSGITRWDEKAGLPRDAIRSQCSTCSRHNEKETGNEKD